MPVIMGILVYIKTSDEFVLHKSTACCPFVGVEFSNHYLQTMPINIHNGNFYPQL
jgi:hypothetical protein